MRWCPSLQLSITRLQASFVDDQDEDEPEGQSEVADADEPEDQSEDQPEGD